MNSEIKFHAIVRGLLLSGTKVLVAHCKGSSNTFLPGGHINPGENTEQALKRELIEELDLEISIIRYLGAIEHIWDESGQQHHELNHIFLIKAIDTFKGLISKEKHLDFFWLEANKTNDKNLQPFALQDFIKQFVAGTNEIWWHTDLKAHLPDI